LPESLEQSYKTCKNHERAYAQALAGPNTRVEKWVSTVLKSKTSSRLVSEVKCKSLSPYTQNEHSHQYVVECDHWGIYCHEGAPRCLSSRQDTTRFNTLSQLTILIEEAKIPTDFRMAYRGILNNPMTLSKMEHKPVTHHYIYVSNNLFRYNYDLNVRFV
jgi:hypothetical protein